MMQPAARPVPGQPHQATTSSAEPHGLGMIRAGVFQQGSHFHTRTLIHTISEIGTDRVMFSLTTPCEYNEPGCAVVRQRRSQRQRQTKGRPGQRPPPVPATLVATPMIT